MMRYTRAENWPGYKIVALKSRTDNNPETRPIGRASPSPASYRALGTKSPVCENHRQAEQDYSTVKAIVKAESQRKLDQALKLAQQAHTPRPVCLTNMYVRPGSALSQDWTAMPYPSLSPRDSNNASIEDTKQRRLSAFDNGKDIRHSELRPNSAYERPLENNRPLFLQNYKAPTSSGRWDSSELADRLGTPNSSFFYFGDHTKDIPLSLKANSKQSHLSDSSKRQKFVFSYFRREMMREKSIVVPLGSIPTTLQVKGNNTRIYNGHGHFPQDYKSRTQDQFKDIPLHSVRTDGHREVMASKSSTTPETKGPKSQSSVLRVNLKNKSPKPGFRDLGAVSEYKLKMTSLSTESKRLFNLPQRPATAAPFTSLQEQKLMEQDKPSSNNKSPPESNSISVDSRLARPASSTGNRSSFGVNFPKPNNEPQSEGKVSTSQVTKKPRGCATEFTTKSPSFIKGIKYGEVVKKKENVSPRDAKDAPSIGNKGIEGKTEFLSKSPKSLTLSVFLPRENNEDPMCNRANAFSSGAHIIPHTPMKHSSNQSYQLKNPTKPEIDSSNLTKGLRYCGPGTVPATLIHDKRDLYLSGNPQPLGAVSNDRSEQNRLKYLHCELFGPDLCQDCQVQIDRADVQTWQETVHPHIGTVPENNYQNTESIQRSCPSPASVSDESDASSTMDGQLEPLTSASSQQELDSPH